MFFAGIALQDGEGDWQNLSTRQPAAPGDGAIFPQYPIQLQLAPLGISLDIENYCTVRLLFEQAYI